jgi:hypothetical protein
LSIPQLAAILQKTKNCNNRQLVQRIRKSHKATEQQELVKISGVATVANESISTSAISIHTNFPFVLISISKKNKTKKKTNRAKKGPQSYQ